MGDDQIGYWGLIISFIGLILTNIFVVLQIVQSSGRLKAMKNQMTGTYRLSLRNKSLSYSLYANSHLRDARLTTEKYFGQFLSERKPIPLTKILEHKQTENTIYPSIMTLLAHWENLALAIYMDVADERTAYEMVAGTLINHVIVFQEFIDERKKQNSRAYQYLEYLKKDWEDRLYPKTRPSAEPILPKDIKEPSPEDRPFLLKWRGKNDLSKHPLPPTFPREKG